MHTKTLGREPGVSVVRPGGSPGRVTLARLLVQASFAAPIPGTRRRERVRENARATELVLSADDVAERDGLVRRRGVVGDWYAAAGVAALNR